MCIACSASLNLDRQNAFADQLIASLNQGMIALMISVGHRTGLFDTLAELPAATSSRLAEAAGLNERYVREWLGAMATGRIVEYDPEAQTYRLPAEHAYWLTRKSPTANLAVLAQYLPLVAQVEDRIVDCFKRGGGVPYSAFPRFPEVMAEDSGQSIVPIIVEQVVPLMPGLAERLQGGIDVLDVGCGCGRALNRLARHYPNSRFTGYDFSDASLAVARREAAEAGLKNLAFQAVDLTAWKGEAAFDWILALDAIHDQARPDLVLSGIQRALRPDGVFLMQDIDASSHVEKNMEHPIGPLLYAVSCFHCMTVSLAQNGMGLGTMWGRELAERMLLEAGFKQVEIRRFAHDIQNAYYLIRK